MDIISNIILTLFICAYVIHLIYEYIRYKKLTREQADSQAPQNEALPEVTNLKRSWPEPAPIDKKTSRWKSIVHNKLILNFMVTLMLINVIFSTSAATRTKIFNYIVEIYVENTATELLMFFAVITAIILFIVLIGRSSQASLEDEITLTKQGISYRSGYPGMLNWLQPDWRIAWSSVTSAQLGRAQSPASLIIKADSPIRKRHLITNAWSTKNCPGDIDNFFMQISEMKKTLTDSSFINNTPLIRYIKQHTNVRIENYQRSPTAGFDLTSNKKTLALVLLFIIVALFAVFDTILSSEAHATLPEWWLCIPGLLMIAAAMRFMRDEDIPKSTKTGLSILLGVTVMLASYPAVLHVNRMTDTQGLHAYSYMKSATSVFQPVSANTPEIDSDRLAFTGTGIFTDYWQSIEPGTVMEFELRKGGLGFYQLNMTPLLDKARYWVCIKNMKQYKHDEAYCNRTFPDGRPFTSDS